MGTGRIRPNSWGARFQAVVPRKERSANTADVRLEKRSDFFPRCQILTAYDSLSQSGLG